MTLPFAKAAFVLAGSFALSGCMTSMAELSSVQHHPNEASVIHTSPVRNSVTPMDGALACYGKRLAADSGKRLGVAIGDVKDYTGKQGQDEGFAITQGGALMAYSALGKLGAGVRVHERFDTRIADAELVYMNQRQLGDGRHHSVDDPNTGQQTSVPWKPYFGGSILQSDFFIVGGITELNYNIQSGGAELSVSNLGPRARVYTMNIAVDLRIVGTQTLMVYDTVSIEKQLSGYEVGVGVFRFFGSNLFDVNVGAKNQEPLQLGVRTAIEAGILQLVASVAGVDPTSCVPPELGPVKWDGANAEVARADATRATAERRAAMAEQEALFGEAGVDVGTGENGSVQVASLDVDQAPELAYAAADTETANVHEAIEAAFEPEAESAARLPDLKFADAATRSLPANGGEFSVVFGEGSNELDGMSTATLRQVASLVSTGRNVNLTIGERDHGSLSGEEQEELRTARIQAVVGALMRNGIPGDDAQLLWRAGSAGVQFGLPNAGLREIARIRVG